MPDEVHISSLVVHATPKRLQRIEAVIALMPGARVYGSSPNGKLVVTLDADSADQMLARVSAIQRTDGVLSAALVYQYADTVEAMNEEIPDAD
ncbi:chaperone NapD [Variovorax saccharolyticus]|uniref:chaperone NapD n=1 Tax=Variovorax saccharolyticus TaxID=3053516 RepID=UPI0025781EA9|nr:chaperone NapD [Variovorax sp. J31P216]MDM0029749.1 chaperone NapD [Variovorax sp. J31P216]